MSIFERLARLARAEFNHVKSVIADRDDDAPAEVRDERLERLRRAREELERAEDALRREEQHTGAAAWGAQDPGADGGASAWRRDEGAGAWRADEGASAWGASDAAAGAPRPGTGAGSTVYPQEIRLAYAALELPLGADKDQVQRAYRDMLSRYHPDKHAQNPQLQQAANELTRRIREARDTLVAWRR
ncbi:MAG: hypothetical protein CVU56_00085 [Deltaproteobacteria bacterium HGW-Deltaproteobacteria-14]|jgi:DnaJ-domain-containing protein 1|nr:MAG: hypothetical protein CVU56_00085 [Deltaproteobacteria bacterium HGW-Deltaproteobacteria-14]